jgi:hypothetical protein
MKEQRRIIWTKRSTSLWALVIVVLFYNMSVEVLSHYLATPWANSLAFLITFTPYALFFFRKTSRAILTAVTGVCILGAVGVFFTSQFHRLVVPLWVTLAVFVILVVSVLLRLAGSRLKTD